MEGFHGYTTPFLANLLYAHNREFNIMIQFNFILQKTYFRMGFFNIRMEFERYFSNADRQITVFVGPQKQSISGRISRRYNINHTPRIFGGVELRNWFQSNFEMMDQLKGVIISEDEIWIQNSD